MLKIRDLGIHIEYRLGYQEPNYGDMGGGTFACPDMSCGGDVYKKPSKKPSKKAPAKKSPAKKPSKKAPSKKIRANGFGSAATAQLGRQLEEQLRDVQ